VTQSFLFKSMKDKLPVIYIKKSTVTFFIQFNLSIHATANFFFLLNFLLVCPMLVLSFQHMVLTCCSFNSNMPGKYQHLCKTTAEPSPRFT